MAKRKTKEKVQPIVEVVEEVIYVPSLSEVITSKVNRFFNVVGFIVVLGSIGFYGFLEIKGQELNKSYLLDVNLVAVERG